MDIYREERKEQLYDFMERDSAVEGRRRRVLAAPPLFVIPGQLLEEVLQNNHIEGAACSRILEMQENEKRRMEAIFSHSMVTDELSEILQEEYEKYPAVLPLADGFLEKNIMLTFREYTACIAAAEKYSEEQKNYEFCLTKVKGFHNIQLTFHEGKWCMESKSKSPSIPFYIIIRNIPVCSWKTVMLPIQDR